MAGQVPGSHGTSLLTCVVAFPFLPCAWIHPWEGIPVPRRVGIRLLYPRGRLWRIRHAPRLRVAPSPGGEEGSIPHRQGGSPGGDLEVKKRKNIKINYPNHDLFLKREQSLTYIVLLTSLSLNTYIRK